MIANGVALDPRVLINEIDVLEKKGIVADLAIDPLATIIFPYHNLLDGISESTLKQNKIGTTGRGVGPAYEDRFGRRGIRFIDLFDQEYFRNKLHDNFEMKKKIIEKIYGKKFELDEEMTFKEYSDLGKRLKKYLSDVSDLVYENIDGKKIIFESAQGTFLDIAYGTYPYVTSSHPISGSVFADVGFPPRKLEVLGIVKAYTTRVGSGVFMTELTDSIGEKIREKGHEFGTTTGRPRRCGWLDLVMLKYANRLNGFSSLAITKLDVLSGIKKIKVGVKYLLDGKEVKYPLTIRQMEKCEIGYEEFDGFDVDKPKKYNDLPKNAKKYLEFIEEYLKVPISIVSVGPERGETIIKDNIKW